MRTTTMWRWRKSKYRTHAMHTFNGLVMLRSGRISEASHEPKLHKKECRHAFYALLESDRLQSSSMALMVFRLLPRPRFIEPLPTAA